MSVGSRIKELREIKNISRAELANSVGVTVGAISNYENEVSSPKEPILFKLMKALDCDANYLFQDSITMSSMKNHVSITEYSVIEKYRELDDAGKQLVNTVLDIEVTRSKDLYEAREALKKRLSTYEEKIYEMQNYNNRCSMVAEATVPYGVNAANKRTDIDVPEGTDTSDDDIMDDTNF